MKHFGGYRIGARRQALQQHFHNTKIKNLNKPLSQISKARESDILCPDWRPEYHINEPKPGLFYGKDSNRAWYYNLKIYDKTQTIKIGGIDLDKVNKRFLDYNCVEMPVYLAIALLGKQQKYPFEVVNECFEGVCDMDFDYGVRFDGSNLFYREAEDIDGTHVSYTCECGEEIENDFYGYLFDLPVGTWTETSMCDYCEREIEIDLRETCESIYEVKVEDGRLSVEGDSKRGSYKTIEKAIAIANEDGFVLSEEL